MTGARVADPMADGDYRASLTLTEEVGAPRAGEVFDVAALQEAVQPRADSTSRTATQSHQRAAQSVRV